MLACPAVQFGNEVTKHSKLLPDIIVSFDMRKSGISQLEKLEANGKRRTFYWPLEKKHIIYLQGAHNPRIQVPAFQHHLGRLSIHRAPGRRRGSTAATTNGGSRSTQSCNAQALRIEFLGCCQLLQTVETHIWIYFIYICIYIYGRICGLSLDGFDVLQSFFLSEASSCVGPW